jgi:hypothetical protein
MKKIRFSFVLALVLLSAVIGVKAQTEPSAFAGNWMLDREKTNTNKDFPEKLRNFKLAVSGTETNLNVKSQIEGKVEVQAAGTGTRTGVTESASRISGGQVGSSSTSNAKVNYGGTMALFFTANDANYKLDGEEAKIETPQGLVRIKAKPDKSGKSLQFTIIRRMKTPNGEMEVITRESWKLSEDGKTLKLHRTVETPTARDDLTMFLSKVA